MTINPDKGQSKKQHKKDPAHDGPPGIEPTRGLLCINPFTFATGVNSSYPVTERNNRCIRRSFFRRFQVHSMPDYWVVKIILASAFDESVFGPADASSLYISPCFSFALGGFVPAIVFMYVDICAI